MEKNYTDLKNVGFLPVAQEDIAATGDAFMNAFEEMGQNDQKAVADFLAAIGIDVTDSGLNVNAVSIWTARALSKKLIAANDLANLAQERDVTLSDEEITKLVDAAEQYPEWARHVHPTTALTRALDDYLTDDDDDDDDEYDEDEDDDDDEPQGFIFALHIN